MIIKSYSDYSIHRLPEKSKIYRDDIKLWWSDELERWMCTDAKVIKEILSNTTFKVPSYSVEKIVSKISVNLEHNIKLVDYFPVAKNGESHKLIRKRHTTQIKENSKLALSNFESYFKSRFEKLLGSDEIIDLYSELLKPSFHEFLASLIDIDPSLLQSNESMSQILDETLPLRIRLRLNKTIGDLVNSMPEGLSEDEKYFKVSVVALGADSLIGTMTESLVYLLKINNGKLLSEINWPDDPPMTGVPVIERYAAKDLKFNNITIQKNQRIRLYLDAAGYISNEQASYAQLYFGGGNHLCPGISLGREIWKTIINFLKSMDVKILIQEGSRRQFDNVFNIYNTIKVIIDD